MTFDKEGSLCFRRCSLHETCNTCLCEHRMMFDRHLFLYHNTDKKYICDVSRHLAVAKRYVDIIIVMHFFRRLVLNSKKVMK
jgi:hypothetical protein